ncbi:AzlD domain-containing protein [Paracoccus luteus]|uniref:AzlD domain-containing protein n=1 Tax=Paracoccus luteus TaxID=2508543 RepID=UPI001FEB0446|nr:AzlD domain-containing protein [Paracoccus luteus]
MSAQMPGWSDVEIWVVIAVLAVGTFLIRWSFLGIMGNRPLPVWAQRLLRYTAVAVLPALVAPLVAWPAAAGGRPEPARIAAAAVTVLVGLATRNTLAAIIGGAVTLVAALALI